MSYMVVCRKCKRRIPAMASPNHPNHVRLVAHKYINTLTLHNCRVCPNSKALVRKQEAYIQCRR